MREPSDDRDLYDALRDAVADVEPAHRLDEIRSRTTGESPEEGPMKENARTWLVGAAGAVLATAAVIVTVAVLGGSDGDETPTAGDPTDSASVEPSPSATTAPSPTPTQSPSSDPDPDRGGTEVTVPVYYTVGTPDGDRLVREFRRVGAVDDSTRARVEAAVGAALTLPPADPDYDTLWPADTAVELAEGPDWIVTVSSNESDLRGRPGGIDADTAETMRQQLVYTLQGVLQERVPVELVADSAGQGGPLLGGTAGATRAGAENDVLALMNVTNPVEGQTVRGDTLTADGRSNGIEANVLWEIREGGADGEIVDEGFTTAEGWIDMLYPWTVDIDVSGLAPGEYAFVARNDDPSGGEGSDSADTKTFVVE